MNNLQTFSYQSHSVRTVQRDGEPWFVLKDVCGVLAIADHKVAARRLDEDEVCQTPLTDSLGRMQETTIINESGLYNVILRSDKPEAKPFRRWVTGEVLPSIRKHGGYIAGHQLGDLSPELRLLIQMELRQKEQQKALDTVARKVDGIRDVVALSPVGWREECRKLLAKIAYARGGAYQDVNREVFDLLDERAHVSLETRLTNKRQRMAVHGASKSRRDRVTKVDVIADDPKLVEIYLTIVKDMAIKYGITYREESKT